MLTWPFDSKSGYRLINGEINSQSESFWKQLWKLGVSCKVRNFIWRCSTGYLPIVDRLRHKKVHANEVCPICHALGETDTHLLFECHVATHCSILSSLNINGCNGSSCFEWFSNFFASHNVVYCSLMVMIGWMLWKNRNDIAWRGKGNDAHFLVNLVGRMLYEWIAVQSPHNALVSKFQDQHGSVIGLPPPTGKAKINIDTALFPTQRKIGVGYIVRDEKGIMLGGFSKPITCIYTLEEAEALGALS